MARHKTVVTPDGQTQAEISGDELAEIEITLFGRINQWESENDQLLQLVNYAGTLALPNRP